MNHIAVIFALILFNSSSPASPTGYRFNSPDFSLTEISGTTIECSRLEGSVIFEINFRRPEQHSKKNWHLESILCLQKPREQGGYEFTSRTELADKPSNVIRFSVPEESLDRVIFWVEYHDLQKHNGRTYQFAVEEIASKLLPPRSPLP